MHIKKIESIAGGLLFSGIILCTVYNDSPNIVFNASVMAFLGFLVEKILAYYKSTLREELASAESVELSLLRQVRRKLSRGEDVSVELISTSVSAGDKSDNLYKKIYGFGRPLPVYQIHVKKPNIDD